MHSGFIILLWLFVAVQNNQLDGFLLPWWLVIGALFPDCDIRYSPAGRIFPLWILKGVKHRGWVTHSVLGLAFWSGCVGVFDLGWGINFAIGYFSHLLLDSITPMGVRWWSGWWSGCWKRKKPTFKV